MLSEVTNNKRKKKRVHKVNNGEQAASIEKEMMLNKNTEKKDKRGRPSNVYENKQNSNEKFLQLIIVGHIELVSK